MPLATPFGYQTSVLVFRIGGYSCMDFVRVGLPRNFLTWAPCGDHLFLPT